MRMKVKVFFEKQKWMRMPRHCTHKQMSLIYRILAASDKRYASFLHNKGYVIDGTNIKCKGFSFSNIYGDLDFGDKYIVLNGNHFVFYVRTPLKEFYSVFMNGARAMAPLKWNGISVTKIQATKSMDKNKTLFRAFSPILLNSRKKGCLIPRENCALRKWERKLTRCALNKIEAMKGEELFCVPSLDFKIKADMKYLLNNSASKYKRCVNFKGKLDPHWGVKIPMIIEGDPETVRYIVSSGMGEQASAGFGYLG